MKFIANILTDKPFKDNDLYNVVSDKNNLIDGIPTLVVGWEYTKKLYPEASILNWEVGNNVYWTYGNREKRNKYEENIVKFRQLALTKFIKSVKYKFYGLLTTTDEEKEYILNLIGKDSGSFIYMNYDMVYIFDDSVRSISPLSALTTFTSGCIFSIASSIAVIWSLLIISSF